MDGQQPPNPFEPAQPAQPAQPVQGDPHPAQPLQPAPLEQFNDPNSVEPGKMWAYISYASFFVGLPAFIIPLAQRDNAYALYHARHAAVSYGLAIIVGIVVTVITVVTCGFGAVLFPLCLFPWITAIHGFILVSNGEWREPILCFGLADRFLNNVTPKAGPPGSGGPTL